MKVSVCKTVETDAPRPASRPERDEAREAGWDAAGVFAALLNALEEVRRESTPSTPSGDSTEGNLASSGAAPAPLPPVTTNAAETNAPSTLPPPTLETAPEHSELNATPDPAPPARAGEAATGAYTPAPTQQTLPPEFMRRPRASGETELTDAPDVDVSVSDGPQHLGDPSRDVSLVAAELASRRLGASRPETEPASLLSFIHEYVRGDKQLPWHKKGAATETEPELQLDSTDSASSTKPPHFAQTLSLTQDGGPATTEWDTIRPLHGAARSLLLREVAELRPHESRTLRLRLKPEELGEVRIELTRAPDGTVSARLDAESAAAARALADSLAHLRTAMQSAGVAVGQLGVGHHTTGGGGESSGRGRNAAPDEAPWGAERTTHAPESFKHEAGGDRLLTLRA